MVARWISGVTGGTNLPAPGRFAMTLLADVGRMQLYPYSMDGQNLSDGGQGEGKGLMLKDKG